MRRSFALLVPFAAALAACGAGSSTSSGGAASTDAAVAAQLMQSGVLCAPSLPPPAVQACASEPAGASCTFTEGARTVTGTCALDDGRLMCAPSASSPPTAAASWEPSWVASSASVQACSGKSATDPCSVAFGMATLAGSCVDLPGGVLACLPTPPSFEPEGAGSTPFTSPCASASAGDSCSVSLAGRSFPGVCTKTASGLLACLPPPPPPVAACEGDTVGASCTVAGVDPSYTGSCEKLWCGTLACLPPPPPPPPIVTACDSKLPGGACTFTSDDGRTIDGVCRPIGMRATLACLPAPPVTPPLVAACNGDAAGASCTVQDGGAQRSGTCRQLPGGGPLVCMLSPPEPIAAAVQACSGSTAAAGDACSFTWAGHTVNGACRAAPDGTLVCAPACGR